MLWIFSIYFKNWKKFCRLKCLWCWILLLSLGMDHLKRYYRFCPFVAHLLWNSKSCEVMCCAFFVIFCVLICLRCVSAFSGLASTYFETICKFCWFCKCSVSCNMSWSVGCIMLLIVNLTDKRQKKILKAVPCQRAKNLFDVGLKSIYFYKRKIWRNFLLDLEQNILTWILWEISSYDTLWAFELYKKVCSGWNFWRDLWCKRYLLRSLYYL